MNGKLFLPGVLLVASAQIWAQTTHTIDWKDPYEGNLTIEVGDTVEWVWGDSMSHNVEPDGGDPPADFGHEDFETGEFTYSYTFTEATAFDFKCGAHSTMKGSITVAVLSVDDPVAGNVSYYPNPVTDILRIEAENPMQSYSVYNVLGAEVARGTLDGASAGIDMSAHKAGVYFVRLATAGDGNQTVIKITKR